MLGRLTERVGPSGPLNETQPEEGEVEGGGEWHRAAIESYFHPPPQLIYPRPPLAEGPGDAAVLRLLPLLLNEIGVEGGEK